MMDKERARLSAGSWGLGLGAGAGLAFGGDLAECP